MTRNFDEWLSTMRKSIANYNYYIDFDGVYKNAEQFKIELNILNSLIGSDDIENEFDKLLQRYPEILRAIPILLAKREREIFCMDDEGEFNFDFSKKVQTIDEYKMFMRKTGLFDLMQNHLINNLVDYVLGVEVGLNSNGRKNRGGDLMENLVENYLNKAGFVLNETYFKEMYLSQAEERFHLNLASISNKGKAEKRFDFVFVKNGNVFACECNFYASSGSKLNETARSYKTIALESEGIPNFKFVWITDGVGWNAAKGNLRETFDVLETLYNIQELEAGILNKL